MPYWVYVLRSEATGKLYAGQTSDLEKRLKWHNDRIHWKQRYTRKQKGLWKLIYSEELPTRSDAMKREGFLKSGQGREWIHANVISR